MLCGARGSAKTGARNVFSPFTRSTWRKSQRYFAHHSVDNGTLDTASRTGGESQSESRATPYQNGTYLGLVACRSPQSTTIEQLVSQINPRPTGRATQRNANNSLLTVFLTPAFAQHALDAQFPLSVLQQFTKQGAVSKSLDAVVAVVDRLPAPNGSPSGVEGLAYAFETNPNPMHLSSQTPLQMSAQKPGSISFELPHTGEMPKPPVVHLPLAQTTFTNGLPSTLIHTRYKHDISTGLLHQSSSNRLESQMLAMPLEGNFQHMDYNMPFIPLTPVRQIMSSMGNIIRKLSPHSLQQEEHLRLDFAYRPEPSCFLSASEELESAVSKYFKLLDISPGPVQVWALIAPTRPRPALEGLVDNSQGLSTAETSVYQARWTDTNRRRRWNAKNLDLFRKGCRMAKVLSGGGGWGKKAGLLSLDPDTGYSTRDLRSDQGWHFTFEDEYTEETVADQQRQALGEVVKPGESVIFFLAPTEATIPALNDSRYLPGSDRAITLGVIPSSIDELPEGGPIESGQRETLSADQHYHDAFGMLSEGGMALTLPTEHDVVSHTKIDVPFGYLTIRAGPIPDGNNARPRVTSSPGEASPKAGNQELPTMKQDESSAGQNR